MSYLGARNAISFGVSQHLTLGGPNLLYKLSPSLLLQFAGAETLDSRVTFTRTTTATRTNSSGLIESVAINGPRFDYNPTTLAPNGLLIEEQRTNLLLNSLIDGTSLSTQIVVTTAVSTTLSFYGTGQIVLSGSSSATVVGTGAYPSRKTLTFTPTVGALTLTVTGTVQYAQLEAGAFSTSYIPTVASQVTRTADLPTMTGTNFSSWYNATEGTFYAEFLPNAVAPATAAQFVLMASDATSANTVELYKRANADVSTRFSITSSGVNSAFMNIGVFTQSNTKLAGAYKVNNFAGVRNAGTVVVDTSGATAIVSQLDIGRYFSSSAYLNGTISRIAFYPHRLENSELQAITS